MGTLLEIEQPVLVCVLAAGVQGEGHATGNCPRSRTRVHSTATRWSISP